MRLFVFLVLTSTVFLSQHVDMVEHHGNEADSCSRAKERLLDADESEDLQGLAYKVQVLCDN